MSDCLQNEDSIVSDLSSSNADSLTGTLDSGDNINSDISIGDAMVSSISDGDSTDSNLGDDGSLYSELVIGGGGGVKYTGQETDSIVVTVDNNVYTISASLKPIKFDSVADFPKTGSEKLIYVDFSNKALYGWDSAKGVYYKLVADVKVPTKLSEFTNDAGFITNTVNNLVEYYKKTETYTQEEIDDKFANLDIDIDFTDYYTKQQTDSLLSNKADKTEIPKDYLPNTIKYGSSIDLSIDSTTYVVTAQLKDQDGNNLGTSKTIDLPLESVVVSGSYDSVNKKVILTLKDGSTIDFSVADLVSGLQKEITSTNKLSVNLIDGIDNYALKSVVDGVKTQASNAEAMARSNRSDITELQGRVGSLETAGGGGSKLYWREWT